MVLARKRMISAMDSSVRRRPLEVAEEEAGMAVRRPEMFDRVVQALHLLDVDRDTEHTPPTK